MSANVRQCQTVSTNVHQCPPMSTNVHQCQPLSLHNTLPLHYSCCNDMFPINNSPFAAQLMFSLAYMNFQLLILILYADIDCLKAFYILCEEGDVFLCGC